ncbi:MAG TPA: mannosyltransferase family protein [Chloroflexia bacterium]|nr:mannosyltransferase family protein [Chloroflexia bacterium]
MESFRAKENRLTAQGYALGRTDYAWLDKAGVLLYRWRTPLLAFSLWRLVLFIMPFLANFVLEASLRNATSRYVIGSYYAGTVNFWTDRLFTAWGRWDGEWYLQVVTQGYRPDDSSAAFFPLYPILTKIVGQIAGGNYVLGGLIVSFIASIAAFILFYELTLRDFGDKLLARRGLVLLAVFPTAFFLVAIYTEALFMALALAAFYCARHLNHPRKWWLAGLFVALAVVTRNIGGLILVSLAWEWWKQHHEHGAIFKIKPGSWRNLVIMGSLPAIALGLWLAYSGLFLGNPLLFVSAQSGKEFARHSAMPWETVWLAVTGIISPATFSESNLINLIFLVWWAVLVILGVRLALQGRYPVSYLIFLVLAFLPGLCAPRDDQPLFAIPRYLLVLFPAFQIMALYTPRQRWIKWAFLGLSAFGLVYLTVHFVQWSWVA